MKKVIVFAVFILAVLVGLGIAGYQFALSFAANKMIDQVLSDELSEEEMAQLVVDPRLMELLDADVPLTSNDDLPFHTKEEALKTVLDKFSIDELDTMKNKLLSGTSEERAEVKIEIEKRLSQEELEALKIVALKELKQRER